MTGPLCGELRPTTCGDPAHFQALAEAKSGYRRAARDGPDPAIQPQNLEAPAVVDAVRHDGQSLELRLPAIGDAWVEQDGPGIVLHQLPFDFPHQPFAFLDVGFGRLPVDQLIDLGVAI